MTFSSSINPLLNFRYSRTGELYFSIDATNALLRAEIGKELNLQKDCGAGLFARMFVGLGGRQKVVKIVGRWYSDSDNYATFKNILAEETTPLAKLAAANATFTGKMAKRFYGMEAAEITETEDKFGSPMYVVTFEPVPVDLTLTPEDDEVGAVELPLLQSASHEEIESRQNPSFKLVEHEPQ